MRIKQTGRLFKTWIKPSLGFKTFFSSGLSGGGSDCFTQISQQQQQIILPGNMQLLRVCSAWCLIFPPAPLHPDPPQEAAMPA